MDKPDLPAYPMAPPPPPVFGADADVKGKPKVKSMQPTFLGGDSVPKPNQLGNKTLLGA